MKIYLAIRNFGSYAIALDSIPCKFLNIYVRILGFAAITDNVSDITCAAPFGSIFLAKQEVMSVCFGRRSRRHVLMAVSRFR